MRANPYPGIFIAIGGIDGSGKSALASEWVGPYFQDLGWETLLTQEPWFGGHITGNDLLLQRAIQGQLPANVQPEPESLQELFIENRRRHYTKALIPFFVEGTHRVVVSDRSYDGTLVYGKATAGAEAQKRLLWKHAQIPGFFLPDLFILLDVPVKVSLQRIGQDMKRGGTKHIFEKAQTLSQVREAYQELPLFLKAQGVEQEFLVVDAQGGIEEVFEKIVPALNATIEKKFLTREERR